jgi:transcriptional regulator with XRE-family HTH domain
MSIEKYREIIREAEKDPDYWYAVPAAEFSADIARLMAEKGVNRAELARRLGTTRPHVTQLLRGDAKLQLLTMVKVALALDAAVHVHVADRHAVTRWIDSFKGKGGDSLFVFDLESDRGFAPTAAQNTVTTYG